VSFPESIRGTSRYVTPAGANGAWSICALAQFQAFHHGLLETENNGHRFVAYVVTWNTAHIVVSDSLAKSHHRVGDEIQFMAQRIEVPGQGKSLSFTLIEP
jgi:hypothetical protein